MVVVSDTSPVSNLYIIGQLDILYHLYGSIVMPEAVLMELVKLKNYGYDISSIENAAWIKINAPKDSAAVAQLLVQLDLGECEAIVLAQELKADFLLIDERRGWKMANVSGIKTIGLLGVLLQAKAGGLIDSVEPLLNDLTKKAGFWVTEKLRIEVLKIAGETI